MYFQDIKIKENAIELLENALKRKRSKCMLATGSMTDPYIPLESEIGNVRKALSLAYQYGFGFTLITKLNRVLRDAGIPTIVWLCPILPFINDTEENITGILNYCIEAEAYGVICFGMGLTLREGNREYFYRQLDLNFPRMKERYIQTYGNQYEINSPHSSALMKLFHQKCNQHGIIHDNRKIFEYLNTFEEKQSYKQLSLFD